MNKHYYTRSLIFGIFILSLTIIGCSVKKPEWGDLKTGLILKYQFPQDQTLTYKGGSDTIQNLEVMGQSMNTTITTSVGYGFKGTGVDDQNNLVAEVIINNFNIAINSPQGNMNPDTSGLNGKSFSATYSPKGKQLKVTGAENLPKINLGQGGERNVTEFFSNFLPVLPDVPVKKGDSWTTPIDNNVDQGPISLTIKGTATNVLEGIETIEGMECAKIKTRTESAVQGSGTQMGMELNLKGDSKTTSTWYFAYKKGLFVKITSDEEGNININTGTMDIPQTTKTKSEVGLIL